MPVAKAKISKKPILTEQTTSTNVKAKSTKAKTGGSKSTSGKKSSSKKSAKSTKQVKQKSRAELRREAMQKKYGGESKASKQVRKERQESDKLQVQLNRRVKEANELAQMFEDDYDYTGAFADARRTLPPSRKKDEDLFSSDIKSEKSKMRELARIDIFESQLRSRYNDDYEALVTGHNVNRRLTPAQQEKVDELRKGFYKGAFGGQWRIKNDSDKSYDTTRIAKDFAEEAFYIYHTLIEEKQSEDYIRMLWNKNNKTQYESETLIIEIYDMVSMGYNSDTIKTRLKEFIEGMSQAYVEGQFDNPNDYEPLE